MKVVIAGSAVNSLIAPLAPNPCPSPHATPHGPQIFIRSVEVQRTEHFECS
jgi:hypothetical protein